MENDALVYKTAETQGLMHLRLWCYFDKILWEQMDNNDMLG